MIKKQTGAIHSSELDFSGILLRILFVICVLAAKPTIAGTEIPTSAELMSFVQKAVALIEKEGEAAFPRLRDPSGEWFQEDQYVFVWSEDGMRYVYPPDPSGEGKSMRNLKDVNGKPIGEWILARAGSPEGGWLHYQWPRPGEIFPMWKTTFVARALAPSGKAYLAGAGRYGMVLERTFIVDLVDSAAEFLSERGRGGFPRLKDKTGEFMFMDTYVFVLALDGTEKVNPAFPNLEGRNLIDHKDAAGKLLVREMIDRTRDGQSAWVEYYWPKPGTAEQVRKLAYVRRVLVDGEEMVVGAGLYEE